MLQLHEEGTYQGEIRNWYLGETPNGTPFIEFVVHVTKQEDQGTGETFEVEKPFSAMLTRFMSPGALTYTLADLKYLGFTDTDSSRLVRGSKNAHNFAGQKVTIRCDHEEYNNKEREKWSLVRRKKVAPPEEQTRILGGFSDSFAEEMDKVMGRVPETDLAGAGSL